MRRRITKMMVARLRHEMTQANLASMVGVTQPRISIWESGKADIPAARRLQIAEILGIMPEDLDESAL